MPSRPPLRILGLFVRRLPHAPGAGEVFVAATHGDTIITGQASATEDLLTGDSATGRSLHLEGVVVDEMGQKGLVFCDWERFH